MPAALTRLRGGFEPEERADFALLRFAGAGDAAVNTASPDDGGAVFARLLLLSQPNAPRDPLLLLAQRELARARLGLSQVPVEGYLRNGDGSAGAGGAGGTVSAAAGAAPPPRGAGAAPRAQLRHVLLLRRRPSDQGRGMPRRTWRRCSVAWGRSALS